MNVYKVYNLLILHPALQRTFHYSVEGEYLALSCSDIYATMPSESDMLTCETTKGHIYQFHPALYSIEQNISWCLYTLFINDVG